MLLAAEQERQALALLRFKGHPPLGVNATPLAGQPQAEAVVKFQRAPTLGGECYLSLTLFFCLQIVALVSMGTHPWG